MSEVDTFSRTGLYEERTSFGQNEFIYSLKAMPGVDALKATFNEGTITLMVPEKQAREWAGNNRVGFSHTQELPGGNSLALLLEKDFACLDETGEDQSDNYPNPKAQ